jgi:GDP-L-fucose synthase
MPQAQTLHVEKAAPILITGGRGMLGRSLIGELEAAGYRNILAPTRSELDLLDTRAVRAYLGRHKPYWVFHLASVVYGLLGNMRNQSVALTDNTLINHNVLTAAGAARVRKIFYAGSVASYPHPYPSLPLTEDALWQGAPHRGEYGYACAKRHALSYLEVLHEEAGIDYCYGVLTNLYGPHDRFDDCNGHVIPSLIRRLHESKRTGEVFRAWGDGTARRDFMHAQDAARAALVGMANVTGVMNICSGATTPISEVVAGLVTAEQYRGRVIWQTEMPTGIVERSVSNRILREYGFSCAYSLELGLVETWNWYDANRELARGTSPTHRMSA